MKNINRGITMVEPKCPKCGILWVWDWEQDMYRKLDGTNCKTSMDKEKGVVFTCLCGQDLGFMAVEEEIISPSEWVDVDWEHWAFQNLEECNPF
jgi:hypothetical protein